jgi:hypothetical protein
MMKVTRKSRQNVCWILKACYHECFGYGMKIDHASSCVHSYEIVYYI